MQYVTLFSSQWMTEPVSHKLYYCNHSHISHNQQYNTSRLVNRLYSRCTRGVCILNMVIVNLQLILLLVRRLGLNWRLLWKSILPRLEIGWRIEEIQREKVIFVLRFSQTQDGLHQIAIYIFILLLQSKREMIYCKCKDGIWNW